MPFLIKDLGTPVAGWPRTDGSRFVAGTVDAEDGELTRRFREAGVVLIGKSNTPEFGITGTTEGAALGPARNPYDPDRIAGGSSGGAAAATAAGIVPLAHASDGLGSIRIPAACCGLVGLKVTRDRNPNGKRDGERVIGFGVDHVVSRTVRDTAAMLDSIGYPEPSTPYPPPKKARPYMQEIETSPGRLRIAFSPEPPSGIPLHSDVDRVFRSTIATLEGLGHELVEAKLPVDLRKLYKAQGYVSPANFAAGIDHLFKHTGREAREEEFEPLTWAAYRRGKSLTADKVMWGMQTLRVLSKEILTLWERFDVFLCPVMIEPPPKIGFIDPVRLEPIEVNRRQAQVFGFTPPFNMTGQPSLSLPLGMSADGLPIGMMFTGAYADEATLLRLAGQLEKEMPWAERHPVD